MIGDGTIERARLLWLVSGLFFGWLDGTIPIVFHCVLALYLYAWGGHHINRSRHERVK